MGSIMRINVFNMKRFFEVVDSCLGPIRLITSGGEAVNIKNNPRLQCDLQQRHSAEGRLTQVAMEIPQKQDYMEIVNFSIWDY